MVKIFELLYKYRFNILSFFFLILLFSVLFFVLPQEETKDLLQTIENRSFDFRQNIIAKKRAVRQDIVIITVDDPSYEYLIDEYGDWPVPRSVYADVIDFVAEDNPKAIILDLLFIKSLNRIPNSDSKLIETLKRNQNAYVAINFDDYSFELRQPPTIPTAIHYEIENSSKNLKPFYFPNCRMIVKEIFDVTKNIAQVNIYKDEDGVTRKIPAIVNYPVYDKDLKPTTVNSYPYLTLKVALDYFNYVDNLNTDKLIIDKNNNLIFNSQKFPLDKNAQFVLNWYGKSFIDDEENFDHVSFWEVIKSMKAEKMGIKPVLSSDYFKDKFVYIGTSVYSLSDIKTVPTSRSMPGVEIQATLLNNLLENDLIKIAPPFYNYLIILLLSLLAIYTALKIKSVSVSVISFLTLLCAFSYFSVYVMEKYNLWVEVIVPFVLSIVIFIASFIVRYLLKSRDFEHTYKLATTDGLTELYNHRFFQEQMKLNIDLYQKNKQPFSLILIDIDFFKKFNDNYGHQAGDAVLKEVARTLKSCVRSQDIVCRYGGEEMAIILVNTPNEEAVKVAQKVCDTVANKKFELSPELTVNVTISLGVSTYPLNGSTPSQLIEYSDQCLYAAKENGRNQVGKINIS